MLHSDSQNSGNSFGEVAEKGRNAFTICFQKPPVTAIYTKLLSQSNVMIKFDSTKFIRFWV